MISKAKQTDVKQSAYEPGVLYVVATPIGNLADISQRALQVLGSVSTVLAEDTRHSKQLFNHYGITTQLKACHEHNESTLINWVKEVLRNGKSLALISDAGTPLISDPGFVLIRALREDGYSIQVVPGPSAVIAALSVAGLPTDRFVFDGFLPAKQAARQTALQAYLHEPGTVALFESSHRIVACLQDILEVLGEDRYIVLARELSKKFETVLTGSAAEVLELVREDSNQSRGEFVVLIAGVGNKGVSDDEAEVLRVLSVLLPELPLKQAASLAAKICRVRKNDAYQLALSLKREND